MSRFLAPGPVSTATALTVAWCGLWQQFSIANVAGGAVLAVALTAWGLGADRVRRVRVGPLARLIWLVCVDLVESTANVAKEILTPHDSTQESIVAVDLGPHAGDNALLLTLAITLTPGTAVVDVDRTTGVFYIHLLHHERADEVISHVNELAHLTAAALPSSPSGALS